MGYTLGDGRNNPMVASFRQQRETLSRLQGRGKHRRRGVALWLAEHREYRRHGGDPSPSYLIEVRRGGEEDD
jgi:hypothetical protein